MSLAPSQVEMLAEEGFSILVYPSVEYKLILSRLSIEQFSVEQGVHPIKTIFALEKFLCVFSRFRCWFVSFFCFGVSFFAPRKYAGPTFALVVGTYWP